MTLKMVAGLSLKTTGGEVVYDTETGHEREITEPGQYPAGTTPVVPENPWQKWDGKTWVDDADAARNALTEAAKNNKKQAS